MSHGSICALNHFYLFVQTNISSDSISEVNCMKPFLSLVFDVVVLLLPVYLLWSNFPEKWSAWYCSIIYKMINGSHTLDKTTCFVPIPQVNAYRCHIREFLFQCVQVRLPLVQRDHYGIMFVKLFYKSVPQTYDEIGKKRKTKELFTQTTPLSWWMRMTQLVWISCLVSVLFLFILKNATIDKYPVLFHNCFPCHSCTNLVWLCAKM